MASDIGGVWRTIGGRRIFIKDGQSLTEAMKESGKFQKYSKAIDSVLENVNKYGISSEKVREAIANRDKELNKLFKNEEDKKSYAEIKKIINNNEIPEKVKDEILKFKTINSSPYSNSFYNSDNINWGSKPEGSIRISDHWNFESGGSIHCKLKGVSEYTIGWKMAEYRNGEYIVLKEFD